MSSTSTNQAATAAPSAAAASATPKTKTKKCGACGQVGGPYPNGDRPRTHQLASGCPRCGWCF